MTDTSSLRRSVKFQQGGEGGVKGFNFRTYVKEPFALSIELIPEVQTLQVVFTPKF